MSKFASLYYDTRGRQIIIWSNGDKNMRKLAATLCMALLLPILLTSCGSTTTDTKDSSRVELTKNGKIIEYTVEDFSASNYDLDELKDFVEAEIKAYKSDNKGRINVRKEKVKNGIAYLTVRYNKVATYAAFNDVECFAGTVAEAEEAGYDVAVDADLEDEADTLYVFIVETDANVTVPGNVLESYCSDGVTELLSYDTVSVEVQEDDFGTRNVVSVIYE